MDADFSKPGITIIGCFFDGQAYEGVMNVSSIAVGGAGGGVINIPSGILEEQRMHVLIRDERFEDPRSRLSQARFRRLVEGRTGLVRLGVCECGRTGVYEDGKVVHDSDFDLVEEVMDS